MTPASRATAPLSLTTPIDALPTVTPDRAAAFRRLGIPTLAHLVHHIPMRHERQEAEATIDALEVGKIVSARGEITDTRWVPRQRRPRFEALLVDPTGQIELIWFNQPYLVGRVHPGMRVRVQGKTDRKAGRRLRIVNPRWEALRPERDEPEAREARLRPVYHAAEDLPSWMIEQAVARVLDDALPLIEDHLPEEYRRERSLPTLRDAYRMMHRPATEAEVEEARRRLVYDELLLLQLGLALKRAHIRQHQHAPALAWSDELDAHVRARLPFTLTPAQDGVVTEIVADLQKTVPANRLIQGDVGAGKTAVALYAMLMAVASKHQAALMAPTEILAEQHYASIGAVLADSKVRIALLTGGATQGARESALRDIAKGRVDLVIGTHALLTESVEFASLGVAVIDEQHRFGVHQRAHLRERKSDERSMPHTLVMTATPIPRTLALTVFGDLDVSVLKGLPPGRQQVTTRLVGPEKADEVYRFVRERVDKGDQAYIVVPAVDGDGGTLKDVRSVVRALEEGVMAGKRVAAVHGRLKRETREHIMNRFRAGLIDVLVATSVIEVGVDVPNATVMVIEQAERFGLAQLHQLRGRVGRGKKKSVCALISRAEGPLTREAGARLKVMVDTNDGFVIAEKDLEIRGPGEIIGARQSGVAPFRLAEFPRDMELLTLARRDAQAWVERSPSLAESGASLLRSRLLKAHGESLGLADIA